MSVSLLYTKNPATVGLDGVFKLYFTSNAHRNPCTSWNHFTSGGSNNTMKSTSLLFLYSDLLFNHVIILIYFIINVDHHYIATL